MSVLKKLQYKQQKEIVVLNAPPEFNAVLETVGSETAIHTALEQCQQPELALVFVKTKEEINNIAPALCAKLQDDQLLWFAYPKKSSRKYKSTINRDKGWSVFGQAGFEPVMQVAIDADWSALRFRKVAFIKTMTRNADFAMSEEGKAKTKPKDLK
ncbi:hypothetical protein SAMN05421780_1047 [Flexibacter flexilis DSM 6793]|uniref:DUF3052 domain-containing protein n=1 Tax=Flexibacter flexilis DSM 6793 TaxID=927664 RepID=A0A1I1HLI3_9BACT|nr:hypothetical protein [Flexibacter flexilis]SFC24686.1 hypothetical protein SAMN05421780_1047 [Flexibacter flexilis DSM 6793]